MSNTTKSKKEKEIITEYESQVKEIRSQLVEQQKCLEQQTDMRVQLLQDLQDFFRKKAEIESEYSRNLEKLAERFMAKTRSTKDHQQYKKDQNLLSPVNCWYLLLNQVRRESKDHATLSDLYLNNVITRFTHVSEDNMRLLKKSKEIIFQLQEDLMKILNELYTCCDLGYHAGLSRALRTYLSAEYSLETSRHEGLDILEGAVEGLDPSNDRQRFMETHPTAFTPPARFSFQPHMADQVSQITALPQVQAELLLRFQQLQSRLSTLKIENEEVRHTHTQSLPLEDLEETMSLALNELRELERQNGKSATPDLVLDTLEQVKSSPSCPSGSTPSSLSSPSDSPSPLSPISPLPPLPPLPGPSSRRSNDPVATFKPVASPRMGVMLRPPALRPKPPILPKANPPPSQQPQNLPSSFSGDKSGTM
ncbi:SLIT-ROBO Rho GTPase-activating protein 1-like [Sinocyclocheilus grahami]|uniref:SLIT-ROBO Rho GTPase-activating protein 1-like n=1 Tax=Sinocyclocheilus grahami TaxID=75366 RepID=UPI0007ACBBC4|nr:PREDICTED: SLIT-ROBO Rho GTPase-activating protein 1-like [Sinocyclocheilus grahami]